MPRLESLFSELKHLNAFKLLFVINKSHVTNKTLSFCVCVCVSSLHTKHSQGHAVLSSSFCIHSTCLYKMIVLQLAETKQFSSF